MQIEVTSPFPFEALPRTWKWIEGFRQKISDDFAPQDLREFIEWMSLKWDRQKTWAVYGDGELGGLIVFERINPWLGTASIVLKPDFQGRRMVDRRGMSVKACRIAFAEMFQEPGLGKIDFFLLDGNRAIGSLLITLGAKREGTLESHTLRNGKPTDLWVYGLTKEHFEVKQHGISIGSIRTDHADQHVGRDKPAERHDQRHGERHHVVEQHSDPVAGTAADHGAAPGVLVEVDQRPDSGAEAHP